VPLSGPSWVPLFPTSKKLTDLVAPFRDNATKFVGGLTAAGASVSIGDTLRPPQRAYLMHFSFAIARESLDPRTVPAMAGVDIQWVHKTPQGQPDLAASKSPAEQMVVGYGIVFKPALTSRHTEGKAIDMTISWQGDLKIANADGTTTTITSLPKNGGNTDLHNVGSTYGVIKLVNDPPHWSSDGH
jgi:hypothetical protein